MSLEWPYDIEPDEDLEAFDSAEDPESDEDLESYEDMLASETPAIDDLVAEDEDTNGKIVGFDRNGLVNVLWDNGWVQGYEQWRLVNAGDHWRMVAL